MFKRHKNKIIISSLVIIGILLILYGKLSTEKASTEEFDFKEYTEMLENKLESFLKEVDGINKATVIITLESSYGQSTQEQQVGSYFNSNGTDNDNSTVILPKIRGVAIACTNGDNIDVQLKVTEIASRYLGISSNRIKIVSID